MALIETLLSAVLPVFSIAAIGYGFAKRREINVEPLSTVSVYILLPALVFHSLATSDIATEVALAAFFGVYGFVLAMFVLTEAVCYFSDLSDSMRNALLLTVIFPNVGNYGLPLSDFAFGSTGREMAVIFIIAQATLMYSMGVFIASRRSDRTSMAAFVRVFHLPMIYAVAAALLLRGLGWVPSPDQAIMEAIALTGEATIPIMLLILGMELATVRRTASVRRVFQATSLTLVISPVIALGIALFLELPNTIAKPFVLLGAMPSAITPLLLLIEFGGESPTDGIEFASAVIFITTVLSIGTVSLLIIALG